MPEQVLGPQVMTSRRRVVYRRKTWDTRQWEVQGVGGVILLKATAVKAKDSILLWLGASGQPINLEWIQLSLPALKGTGRTAMGSTLLGPTDGREACCRLSAALNCPVYLAGCGDVRRLLSPPVERAILQYLRTWIQHDAS